MNDLRKAAEMALKALENMSPDTDTLVEVEPHVWEYKSSLAIQALRQALAQPDEVLAEREACAKVCEQLGMATNGINERNHECAAAIRARRDDLQAAIEKGTKAWADVPNATEWVEELRGNDTPEEAFTLDRGCYERGCVAFDERDGDGVIMLGKRVHKTDKSIPEPEGWVKIDEVRQYFDSVGCGTIYKTAGEDRVPLYSAPYTKLDTTAGVLHKEWVGLSEDEFEKILETHNEAMPFAVYLSIEAKLKEKNT